MFCRHCGNQLADDAKFCNKCGGSVSREIAEPVVPPVPTPVILPEQPMTPPPAAEQELPPPAAEPIVTAAPVQKATPKAERKKKGGVPSWLIILLAVLGGLIIIGGSGVFVYDAFWGGGQWFGLDFSASDADDEDESEDKDKDGDNDKDKESDKDADDTEDKDSDKNNTTSSSTQQPDAVNPDLDKVTIENPAFEWHNKDLCLDFDIVNDSGADLSVEKISFQLLSPDGQTVVATHTKEYFGMTLAKDTTLYQFIFFAEANMDRSIMGLSADELLNYTISYEIFFQ